MSELIDQFSDAAVFGDFAGVKKLLESNPELLNTGDDWGFTALHNMMSEEQFEILGYLVDQGVNVNVQNNDGIAPLHLACYVENAEALVAAGADINLADYSGNTPLHIHAAEGNKSYEIIEYLLKQGADSQAKNNSNELPIDISKSREDHAIVALFSK